MIINENEIATILDIVKMKCEAASNDFTSMVLYGKFTKDEEIKMNRLVGEITAYIDLIFILERMLEGKYDSNK